MPEIKARPFDRFVLDTNVIVSAAMVPETPSGLLFDQVVGNKVTLICAESLAELHRVFAYDRIKARISQARINITLQLVESIGEDVVITGRRHVVPDDPDDDKLIEMAEIGAADCIVTADSDL